MRSRKRKRSIGLREIQPLGIDVPPLPSAEVSVLQAKSDFITFFNSAWAYVDLGSALTDLWISCDIQFNDQLITDLKSNYGIGWEVIHTGSRLAIQPHSYDGSTCAWDIYDTLDHYNGTDIGSIVGSTWYHLDYRAYYNSGVFSPEFFVNEIDMGISRSPIAPSSSNRYIGFGTDANFYPNNPYNTYLKNIKIGTSKGSAALFDGAILSGTVVPPFSYVDPPGSEANGQLVMIADF